MIAALYTVAQQIRNDDLTGQAKRIGLHENYKPILDGFFAWIGQSP